MSEMDPTSESRSTPEIPVWALDGAAVARRFDVRVERGLSRGQVAERRRSCGANELREAKRIGAARIFARQLQSMIVVLLIAATGISLFFGQRHEAAAIVAVIVINTVIGFVTELRSVRSMEALRQLGRVRCRVRRDGRIAELDAAELVPGDVVVIEAGDLVPADLRVMKASKLRADESALTGESAPVAKSCAAIEAQTSLAERRNILFRGTSLTRGSAEGIAVATGMATEVGQVAHLVEEAEGEATPLEQRLDRLATRLIWITMVVTLLVTLSGVAAGRDLLLMVETGIALAIATVPEGLPIVATIALARGMWRMARRNALINRLSAVETLGSTTVICSDKTGTLTENRMTVTRIFLDGAEIEVGDGEQIFVAGGEAVDPSSQAPLREALEIGALCNNAELSADAQKRSAGEPMEVALLAVARKAGIERRRLTDAAPEVREEAFEPDSRKMATFHRVGAHFRVAVKGAPEAVLEVCSRRRTNQGEDALTAAARREWLRRNRVMAEAGLRVLALASKVVDRCDANPYQDLVLVALVGLMDPPRAGVADTIAACRAAGMRVVMVTGDQPGTAVAIGHALGLLATDEAATVLCGSDLKAAATLSEEERHRILAAPIFARVDPRQKLDLIAIHQGAGAVVAMTGDGVNDAPALKKADIGVAMGRRGTQVAAQAADMVLRDDAFSTIVAAVEQGRVIFENIRRFVLYLLSCNVSEVLVVAIATLAGMPLPIEPLQILFLNLVTDVFPALALGVGEGDRDVMRRPPRRPGTPILERQHWWAIGAYGLVITVSVLAALTLATAVLGLGARAATTVSFLTLAFAQLWHVFNMRHDASHPLRNDVVRNPWIWAALAVCAGLLFAAVYLPPLAVALQTAPPGAHGWLLVALASAAPLVAGQLVKLRAGA